MGGDQGNESALLQQPAVTRNQLAEPRDPARSATVRRNGFDFRDDVYNLFEKNRVLESPVQDTHQRERGRSRVLRGESRENAQSEQPMGHRRTERRMQ